MANDAPMKALVVGLARSGRAAVDALAAQGTAVVAYDRSTEVDLTDVSAETRLGEWDDGLLDGVELVVKSPGVPDEAPPIVAAHAAGIPVISEIELGARLLPNPILGVTGTNGKTTTTALLGAIFEAAGVPVEVAGNIGRPLSSLVGSVDPSAWIVCELSSFQLEGVETLKPRIAVLTNLEPDHLDRHGSFEAYAAAKLRVFAASGRRRCRRPPEGVRCGARLGSSGRVRGRRRASGGAADPRRPQPRERSGCHRGCAGSRHR